MCTLVNDRNKADESQQGWNNNEKKKCNPYKRRIMLLMNIIL